MRYIKLFEDFVDHSGLRIGNFDNEPYTFAEDNLFSSSGLFRFHLEDGSGGGAIGFLDLKDLKEIQEDLNKVAIDEQLWELLRLAKYDDLSYLAGLYQRHSLNTASGSYDIHIEEIPKGHKWLLWGDNPSDMLGDMSDEDREKIGVPAKSTEDTSDIKSYINDQGEFEELPKAITHTGEDSRLMINPIKNVRRSKYPEGDYMEFEGQDENEDPEVQYNIPIVPHRLFLTVPHEVGFIETTVQDFLAYYRSWSEIASEENIKEQYPEGLSDAEKKKFLHFIVQTGASEEILDRMTRFIYRSK